MHLLTQFLAWAKVLVSQSGRQFSKSRLGGLTTNSIARNVNNASAHRSELFCCDCADTGRGSSNDNNMVLHFLSPAECIHGNRIFDASNWDQAFGMKVQA
jgi:hypothetical protein